MLDTLGQWRGGWLIRCKGLGMDVLELSPFFLSSDYDLKGAVDWLLDCLAERYSYQFVGTKELEFTNPYKDWGLPIEDRLLVSAKFRGESFFSAKIKPSGARYQFRCSQYSKWPDTPNFLETIRLEAETLNIWTEIRQKVIDWPDEEVKKLPAPEFEKSNKQKRMELVRLAKKLDDAKPIGIKTAMDAVDWVNKDRPEGWPAISYNYYYKHTHEFTT